MKYEDIRPIIKSGDILAWSEGSWTSFSGIQNNIIRIFTRSEYSHVGVAYVAGGRVFVIEAVVPMIRIFPLSKLLPFYHFESPDNWWSTDIEESYLNKVGKPYSKVEAIKAFLGYSTDGEEQWECAKLINRVLMNVDKDFDKQPDTPTAVVKFIQSKYNIPAVYVE